MNFPSLAFQTRTKLACFLWDKGARREPGNGLMLPTKIIRAQDMERDIVLTLGVIIEAR